MHSRALTFEKMCSLASQKHLPPPPASPPSDSIDKEAGGAEREREREREREEIETAATDLAHSMLSVVKVNKT
jgi:hypothetical protein